MNSTLQEDIPRKTSLTEAPTQTIQENTVREFGQSQATFEQNYFATIIHDMKTPINLTLYFLDSITQALQSQQLDLAKQLIKMSETNMELLITFVHDLLDLHLMKEGKFKMVAEDFDIFQFIQEIQQIMIVQTQLKGIDLQVENNLKQQNFIINSDKRRLKQILFNFLSNAIKFTNNGYIKIILKQSLNKNLIKVFVEDTGFGIPQENIDKLAKPFNTYDNSSQMNKEGVGLGLYICQQLAGQLGPVPEIEIHSELGKGSIFGLSIFTNLMRSKNDSTYKNETLVLDIKQFKGFFTFHSMEDKSEKHYEYKKCQSSTRVKVLEQKKASSIQVHYNLSQQEETNSEQLSNLNLNSSKLQEGGEVSRQDNTIYQNFRLHQNILITNKGKFKKESDDIQNNEEKNQEIKEVDQFRILIVDDNIFNIFVVKQLLKKLSPRYFADQATNGKQALDFIIENPNKIQLILMDIELPIMNGYQATQAIRELEDNSIFQPTIIAYSSHSLNDYQFVEKCIKYGIDGFLQKPCSQNKLQELLEKFDQQ